MPSERAKVKQGREARAERDRRDRVNSLDDLARVIAAQIVDAIDGVDRSLYTNDPVAFGMDMRDISFSKDSGGLFFGPGSSSARLGNEIVPQGERNSSFDGASPSTAIDRVLMKELAREAGKSGGSLPGLGFFERRAAGPVVYTLGSDPKRAVDERTVGAIVESLLDARRAMERTK